MSKCNNKFFRFYREIGICFHLFRKPFISNPREAYRDDMASVCKLIIKTCDMACKKQDPTCGGGSCRKWVYDSTYSRATALTSNVLARLVVCVGLDKGGYPRGKAWEIFAYFASGQSKCLRVPKPHNFVNGVMGTRAA